jgi:hypothetical protein
MANKKLKKIETDDDDLIKSQEKITSEAIAKANAQFHYFCLVCYQL